MLVLLIFIVSKTIELLSFLMNFVLLLLTIVLVVYTVLIYHQGKKKD